MGFFGWTGGQFHGPADGKVVEKPGTGGALGNLGAHIGDAAAVEVVIAQHEVHGYAYKSMNSDIALLSSPL